MKNILPYLLVVVIVILAIKNYVHRNELKNIIKELPKTNVTIQAEEVARQVDTQGSEHVIYKESEPIIKLIELKVEDKARVDSLLILANIKEKQLKSLQTTYANVTQENIELKRMVKGTDTVYQYKDKYLYLSFNRKSDDLALGSFSYDLDLNTASHWKRDWLLAPKKGYIDIWSSDPRVTIKGMDRISIMQKTPPVSIGIGALSTYSNDAIGYGGGLRVGVNRLSVTGGYLYYPSDEKWKPTFSAWYDLIKF